jgi:hypothetical protein
MQSCINSKLRTFIDHFCITMARTTRRSNHISRDKDRYPHNTAEGNPPTQRSTEEVHLSITSSPSRHTISVISSPSRHTIQQESAPRVVFPPPVQTHSTAAIPTSAEVIHTQQSDETALIYSAKRPLPFVDDEDFINDSTSDLFEDTGDEDSNLDQDAEECLRVSRDEVSTRGKIFELCFTDLLCR